MTKPNKIYLLMHASGLQFKIGIAVQTHTRAGRLPDDIDLSRSLEAVVTSGRAIKVEEFLHYLFRDFSKTAERVAQGNVGDGYTEWYGIEAFDEARAIVDAHAVRLGVGPLRPVELPAPRASNNLAKAGREPAIRHAIEDDEYYAELLSNRDARQYNFLATRTLKTTLCELRSSGALMGLHIDGAAGQRRARLFFSGPTDPVEDLTRITLLDVSRGEWSIFPAWTAIDPPGYSCLSVSDALVNGDHAGYPLAGEIWDMLMGMTPLAGSDNARAIEIARDMMRDSRVNVKPPVDWLCVVPVLEKKARPRSGSTARVSWQP
jgi:hypothetical protein